MLKYSILLLTIYHRKSKLIRLFLEILFLSTQIREPARHQYVQRILHCGTQNQLYGFLHQKKINYRHYLKVLVMV
nr:MAG TPA: hypothetical protein [Caudoviricetes sp.]